MLVSDIVNRVRNAAGDTNVLQFSDARIIQWVNDGMRECAIDNDLMQKSISQTVTAGTNEYLLPADIAKLHSVRYDNQKSPVLTLEEFDEQYGATDLSSRGTPLNAVIWAGKVRLFPSPDSNTAKLAIDYIAQPTEVVSVDDTPVIPVAYHRRLVDYCLAMVAEQDDDMQKYQLKMDEFRSGVQNLKDSDAREMDVYPSISADVRDMGEGLWEW